MPSILELGDISVDEGTFLETIEIQSEIWIVRVDEVLAMESVIYMDDCIDQFWVCGQIETRDYPGD